MSASVHFPVRATHFHYSPKKKRPVPKYSASLTKSITLAHSRTEDDTKCIPSILKRSRHDQSVPTTPSSSKRIKGQESPLPLTELGNTMLLDPTTMRPNRLPPLLRSSSSYMTMQAYDHSRSSSSSQSTTPHYRLYGETLDARYASSQRRLESVFAHPSQKMRCKKPDLAKELQRAHARVQDSNLDLGPSAQDMLSTLTLKNSHPAKTVCAPNMVIGTHVNFLLRLKSFQPQHVPLLDSVLAVEPRHKPKPSAHHLPSSPPVEDESIVPGTFKCSVCLLAFSEQAEMLQHHKLCSAGRNASIHLARQPNGRKYATRASTDMLMKRTPSPPPIAGTISEPYRATRMRTRSGEGMFMRRPINSRRQQKPLLQQDEQIDIIGCVCLIPKDDPLYRMMGLNKRGRKPQIRDKEIIIQCDVCHLWLHARCIRMQDKDIHTTMEYVCPKCTFATRSRQRQYGRFRRTLKNTILVDRRDEYVDVVGVDEGSDYHEDDQEDDDQEIPLDESDSDYVDRHMFSDEGTVTDHYDPIMTSSPGSYLFRSNVTTPGARTSLRHEWSMPAGWTEDEEDEEDDEHDTVVEQVTHQQSQEIVEYALHDSTDRTPAFRKSAACTRNLSLVIQSNNPDGTLSGQQTAVHSPIEVDEPPLLGGIVVDEDKRDIVQRMITTTTPGWVAGILTDHSVGASRLGYRRHAAFDCSSPTPSMNMRTESLLSDGLDTTSNGAIRPPTAGLVILRPSHDKTPHADSLNSSFLEDFLNIEAFSDEA